MVFLIIIFILLLLSLAVYLFFRWAPQIGAAATGARLDRIRHSQAYRNGQFRNLSETSLDMSLRNILRSLHEMLRGKEERVPRKVIRTVAFDAVAFTSLGQADDAALCWFGHSTLLIRLHAKTFLTDPVLVGERASMLSFIGPRRFPYSNPFTIEQLPEIDAVILSHDHYDHLDYKTIKVLNGRVKEFIVPLGVGAHLEKWGVTPENIREYDWWDTFAFDENIRLTCAPTRHFSGRKITGRNSTLWCSWIFSGIAQRIYFGADSGYSPNFSEIGRKYGPFDLTILECGAYSKYWPEIHMTPEEAIQAHLDLKGRKLMPVHWAKFNLSLHAWNEPIQRLQREGDIRQVNIVSPRPGELITVEKQIIERWWEDD